MSAKKNRKHIKNAKGKQTPPLTKKRGVSFIQWKYFHIVIASCFFFLLTSVVTYPLILNMKSSTYGSFENVSTDLYSAMRGIFWWVKYSIIELQNFPTNDSYFCAPYGQFVVYPDLFGFLFLPLTVVFGGWFAYNLCLLFGFFSSGMGMYLLVHYLTKNEYSSFVSGVIYAFCPLVLLRGFTTFDTIHIEWIPLYILFIMKFDSNRSWKNALLCALFLILSIIASFPYYIIFLPILTIVYIIIRVAIYLKQKNSIQNIFTKANFNSLVRLSVAGALVIASFFIYKQVFLTAPSATGKLSVVESGARDISQQLELRLEPKDYFVPVEQSAVFRNLVKDYWLKVYQKERRNSINSAAYIGYVALLLAIYGIYRRRDRNVLFFGVVGFLAFITTLGPYLNFFGLKIPTPAWAMFQLAPFVRRINIYKVYVQLSIAVSAGIGLKYLLDKFTKQSLKLLAVSSVFVLLSIEYTIVPPFLNTDLSRNPSVYDRLANVKEDMIVMEYPMRKAWGHDYQGYGYYQTVHKKRLFNGNVESSYIPLKYRSFWKDMEVPAAISDYNNQALLRYFGVRYVLKHYRNQCRTLIWRSLPQPSFTNLPGLKLVYESPDFRQEYRDFSPRFYWQYIDQLVSDPDILDYPHDYIWTNIFEVVAESATVMLKWDYRSPYPKTHEASEYFVVRLSEKENNFYPPTIFFFNGQEWIPIQQFDTIEAIREQALMKKLKIDLRAWRIMKNNGIMKALNLLKEENNMDIVFDAFSFGKERTLQVFIGDKKIAELKVETMPKEFIVRNIRLRDEEEKTIRFYCPEGATQVSDGRGGKWDVSVAFHNFRILSNKVLEKSPFERQRVGRL